MANKIVDYIKLLTMIKEGKIVEGITIERYEGQLLCGTYILSRGKLVLNIGESVLENINSYETLFNSTFKIISEETNIDNLEELPIYENIENYNNMSIRANRLAINDLIKAVKQINKKLEER